MEKVVNGRRWHIDRGRKSLPLAFKGQSTPPFQEFQYFLLLLALIPRKSNMRRLGSVGGRLFMSLIDIVWVQDGLGRKPLQNEFYFGFWAAYRSSLSSHLPALHTI